MQVIRISAFVGVFALAAVRLLSACTSLSNTTPVPSADISDLDAGHIDPPPDAAAPPPTSVDAGPPAAAVRIRVANLLQSGPAIDLCSKVDATGTSWEGGKITAFKPEGLKVGEVSAPFSLPAGTNPPTKYLFRVVPVGTACETDPPLGSIASRSVNQGSGITIVAVGKVVAGDAGDATPRAAAVNDVLAPAPTAAQIRAFHGVPDLPAFDLVVNGDTLVPGIKFGSAIGYPYTSSSGFASVPAGIAEGSTITLRAGTTAYSFTVKQRTRRGLAMSLFVSGTADKLKVSYCSDRSPDEGETVSSCTELDPAAQ